MDLNRMYGKDFSDAALNAIEFDAICEGGCGHTAEDIKRDGGIGWLLLVIGLVVGAVAAMT